MPTRRHFATTVLAGVFASLAGCASEPSNSETAAFGDVGQARDTPEGVEGPTHRAQLFEGYHRLEQSRTAFGEYLDGTAFPVPPAFSTVPDESVRTAIDAADERFETALNAAPGDPSPQHRQAPRLAAYHRELYRFTQELTQIQRQAATINSTLSLEGSRPSERLLQSLADGIAMVSDTPLTARLTALSRQHDRLSFEYIEMPTRWERTSPPALTDTSPFDIDYLRTRLQHDRSLVRGMETYHAGRNHYADREYASAQSAFERAYAQFNTIDGEYERMADLEPVTWIQSDLAARQAALDGYLRATEDMFRALVGVTNASNATASAPETDGAVARADGRLAALGD